MGMEVFGKGHQYELRLGGWKVGESSGVRS